MDDTVKGSDGRTYRRLASGHLVEEFDAKAHAKRQLDGITAKHTITGLRLTDISDPDAPAVVVTMSETEAKKVVAAVKDVLKARD